MNYREQPRWSRVRVGIGLRIITILLGLSGWLSSTAAGQSYFFNRTDVITGVGSPRLVATADFNRDGKLDLAVVNEYAKVVSILLGRPDGTFQGPVNYPIGTEPESIVVADFNGDGKLDLAIGNKNDNTVSVLLGNGDGTFQPKVDYATTGGPQSIAVGDFNGDGRLDLVVLGSNCSPTCNGGFYSILLGNGDGTFQNHIDYATVFSPSYVQTADLNGDDKLDLVIVDSGYNDVSQVCAYLGHGDGTFGSGICNPTGQIPDAVSISDVNSDGKLDLITANSFDNTVSVLLGNGDGTFQPHTDYPTGTSPGSLTIADLDGDGKPDIVTTNQVSNDISVLIGKGDGTFQPFVAYGAGDFPASVVAGDFNGDGQLDLAVANGSSVTILLGKGGGAFFSASSLAGGGSPNSVAAGDFKGDGKTDMVVANSSSNTVSVYLGNGDGTFLPRVDYATGNTPSQVITGDFNGDGHLDLAVAYVNSPGFGCGLGVGTGGVSILLGNGDGTFQPAMNYSTSGNPIALAAGDFNRDGKLDLVVANNCNTTVSVLLGNGDGSFQPHVDYNVGQYFGPRSVAVADFNGDGKPDLAVLDYSQAPPIFEDGALSVLLGNGDGTFQNPMNSSAWCQYLHCSVVSGDFNGDGKADLAAVGGFQLWVWLGKGDGTFQPPVIYANELNGASIAMGDFNKRRKDGPGGCE